MSTGGIYSCRRSQIKVSIFDLYATEDNKQAYKETHDTEGAYYRERDPFYESSKYHHPSGRRFCKRNNQPRIVSPEEDDLSYQKTYSAQGFPDTLYPHVEGE
jgi:hypothetical protein